MSPTLQTISDNIGKVKGWIIAHAIFGSLIAFALGVMVGRFL